ncbi:MAG: hypothetical protein ACJ8AT_33535 [Hyalangium sp.]|uniref:hypothetical protein n=1 Tax=Hyalangium sp. TaxID=2028555 RepID=UPI003899C31D
MELSRQDFVEGLHSECLEEASFLYQQRASLRAEGRLARRELGRLERRMDAFLDAAFLGFDATAALCARRIPEGDPGDWYVAARLLARLGQSDRLAELLRQVDVGNKEQLTAVREGLCHQVPSSTFPQPAHLPAETHPQAIALLVAALGHGRRKADWVQSWTEQMLRSDERVCVATAASYLGRVETPGAVELLRCALDSQAPAVKVSAAYALLRLGDPEVASSLLAPRRFPAWACPLVGVGGGHNALGRLVSLVENGEGRKDGILALGVLGAPSAVPVLIAQLTGTAHAEEAARALHLLTGAGLREEIAERETLDEAESFSDEHDTREETIYVWRLSQQATHWSNWWKEHRARFDSSPRWRMGKPFSPAVLLESLSADVGDRISQQIACDELAIRYGIDCHFEPDGLQSGQTQALRNGYSWLAANEQRFTHGRWYLATRPL